MNIAKRQSGDVVILDLQGKLVIGTGDVAMRKAFVSALEGGATKILINLDDVKTIDSSGLGELMRCRVTAAEKNAQIKLLNVNLKARKLLTMASLVGVFEMFDNEALAVESFG